GGARLAGPRRDREADRGPEAGTHREAGAGPFALVAAFAAPARRHGPAVAALAAVGGHRGGGRGHGGRGQRRRGRDPPAGPGAAPGGAAMRLPWLAPLLPLLSCGADPCGGESGSCLAVHVRGSIPALDTLRIEIDSPQGDRRSFTRKLTT